MDLVQRLPVCQDPRGAAFTEERAGSETRPHHVLRTGGSFGGLELLPLEISGPHSFVGESLPLPPGLGLLLILVVALHVGVPEGEACVWEEGSGTGASNWDVPF